MSLISAGRDAYRVDSDGIRFVMCDGPLHVVFETSRVALTRLTVEDLKAGAISTGEIMSRAFLRHRDDLERLAARKYAEGDRLVEVNPADFERVAVAA